MDSGVSVSAGPRVGKSVSEPSTQVPEPGLKVDITAGSVGSAMGALQFATTGVAPVSIEEKKKLVSDNEVIASQLSEQRKKSAGVYLANKQAGKDPYLDPEFQAQKQRE